MTETKAVLLNWGGDRIEPRALTLPRDAQAGSEFAYGGVRWQVIGLAPKASQYGLPALSALACIIAPVPFPTTVTTTLVPSDKARELVHRMKSLESARSARQKIEAAIETGESIRLTSDEKHVVLDVIVHWMNEMGIDELGDDLAELRYEIIVDLEKDEAH